MCEEKNLNKAFKLLRSLRQDIQELSAHNRNSTETALADTITERDAVVNFFEVLHPELHQQIYWEAYRR